MDKISDDDEEFQFFDARENVEQEFDVDCNVNCDKNWEYDVWVRTPQSVGERRRKFIGSMGLNTAEFGEEISDNGVGGKDGAGDFDRLVENNGAVLRTSSVDVEFPSVSGWNTDDRVEGSLSESRNVVGNSSCRNGCTMAEDRRLGKTRSMKLGQLLSADKHESALKNMASVNRIEQRSVEVGCSTPRKMGRLKDRWLRKWQSMTCIANRNTGADNMVTDSLSEAQAMMIRRVKVRHCRRKFKDLSAVFAVQDIQAHEGSILTMKFSPNGQYLASAGEDKVVRVWRVVEEERLDTACIPDADPSCVYFTVNHFAELEPLIVEKDKVNNPKNLSKTPDPACIIFPPKVFRILEKPMHVFRGHTAEILDLSWSKDNCLLSSSVDKTVRLWRVGVDHCLKVFNHPNYVTCIQFNPMYEDYFISGSIDGKVRIWTISGCQVVQWAEMRDIITAVSYRPDGKGGIVGSITGSCRFFNISDNNFELETDTCLINKKKSLNKRITGFQFFPQDPRKVLVTSADPHVRILDGTNVIGKYKGLRNAGHYVCAMPTADGKHIISASDNSNVYIWNHITEGDPSFSHAKVIKSFECFASDCSVAVPWPGLKLGTLNNAYLDSLPFWSSTHFSLSREYLLDSGSKGSATWPEENLPVSSPPSAASPLTKSQYKLLKMSYDHSSKSHAWGLVIVTAGWDGRIRSFQNYGLPVPV